MHLLIIFALMMLSSWVFPSGFKYLLVAPLLGFVSGGFAWAIAAMFLPMMLSLSTFATFVAVAVIFAELMALRAG